MGNNSTTILYNCESKYQGQILNNQPHGKGTLYIKKDSSQFMPGLSLLQNQQYGKIDGYFNQGKLIRCKIENTNNLSISGNITPSGEFSYNRQIIDLNDKVKYSGQYDQKGHLVNGSIQCLTTTDSNVILYTCQAQQYIGTSIINGVGKYHNITDNYLANGQFYKGNLVQGIYIYNNGDCFQGQFTQGSPNGSNGIYKTNKYGFKNSQNLQLIKDPFLPTRTAPEQTSDITQIGFEYKGGFESKVPSGKGNVSFQNGDKYKGKFKEGKMHGYGQYTFADGTIYKGNFYCGIMNGTCTIQYTKASIINLGKQKHEILEKYEGEINESMFHGIGILYYQSGVIFKGYFLDGYKNGQGVLIYGTNKFRCLYMMNKLIGEIDKLEN